MGHFKMIPYPIDMVLNRVDADRHRYAPSSPLFLSFQEPPHA